MLNKLVSILNYQDWNRLFSADEHREVLETREAALDNQDGDFDLGGRKVEVAAW